MHLWSDSKDILFWLRKHLSSSKTFVANKCSSIQTLLPSAHWNYVKSADNPAYVASRGLDLDLLSTYTHWWQGPSWLCGSSEPWSTTLDDLQGHNSINSKTAKKDLISHAVLRLKNPEESIWDLGLKYSSQRKLFE